VLSVQVGEDVNFSFGVFLGQLSNFVVETLLEARQHGGTSREDDVVVKVRFQVSVALIDRIEGDLSDAWLVNSCDGRVEEDLGGLEPFVVIDLDDLLRVGQFVRPLLFGKRVSGLHSVVKIEGHRAHLLLHFSDVLKVVFIKWVASFCELLGQLSGDILASHIQLVNSMG
jgi:hypothetical protein